MILRTENKLSPAVRRRKAGFGIAEILVSAAVLGFMIVALNQLQSSNRDTIMRVRSRDGAVAVSQQVIDSLSAVGVSALQLTKDASGAKQKLVLHKTREWKGTPGTLAHTTSVDYTVRVDISDDDDYKSTVETSYYPTNHVYAKKLNVEVEWTYKGTPHSVSVSSVVR